MKNNDQPVWTKTNLPNLYRHRNQRYYARVFTGGKEIWKSLKTTLKSVAVERLREHVTAVRQQRASGGRVASGSLTVGEAFEIYRQTFLRDAELAQGTKNYREAGIKRVMKTWPELASLNVRKVTIPMVREWALGMRANTTPYVPSGARRPSQNSKGTSPTTYNCALDAIRQALDVAVEGGFIFVNPARDRSIKRAAPRVKRLSLPTRQQFLDIAAAIDTAGYGECRAAAEMVRFLAFTGARQTEAANVCWKDVDFDRGRVTLRVTKNGETRDVPMITECRALLEGMRTSRGSEPNEQPILRVKECRGFLAKACAKVGAPRIGHHGLRHLFATTAIEAGIDVPTVARLMGHRDGGALAMKIYGHLRDDHAQAAMQRLSFAPSLPPSNVVILEQRAA